MGFCLGILGVVMIFSGDFKFRVVEVFLAFFGFGFS